MVWAAEGKDAGAGAGFFDALGLERVAKLETVSIDVSSVVVHERAPSPVLGDVTEDPVFDHRLTARGEPPCVHVLKAITCGGLPT